MNKLVSLLVTSSLTTAALTAYGAAPTGAQPFQIVVPNMKSGMEFTLEGLLLQPTNSDLDYATTITPIDSNTVLSSSQVNNVNPQYDFGFRIGLGYVFPNSGNDIQASWTHFDHSTNDSLDYVGFGPDIVTPSGIIFNSGNNSGRETAANSQADFQYDAVDLDIGQYLSVGTRLTTRLFAGLRYAQIKNDLNDFYIASDAPIGNPDRNVTDTETYNSKFTGIGPRFGVDASYHLVNCFGIVSHFSAALLVGSVEANSSVVFDQSNFAFPPESPTVLTASADNQTRVVPAFDAKLGIDYSWPFQNDAQRFTVEAGYQVTEYVDAIDRLNMDVRGFSSQLGGATLEGVSRSTSSISFNGPYLTLKYKM